MKHQGYNARLDESIGMKHKVFHKYLGTFAEMNLKEWLRL